MPCRPAPWPLTVLVLAASGPAWARSHPDEPYVFEPDDELTKDEPVVRTSNWSEVNEGAVNIARTRHRDELHGHWRLSVGAGLRFGTFLVNNLDTGTNMQGHLDLGMRKRRWWIATEYALMSTTLPGEELAARGVAPTLGGDIHGLVHRLGAFARYSISRLGCRDAGFDVYVEGGAGVQHLRWDDGGAWTRPDVSLGFGIGSWVLGDDDHVGLTVGLRVTLAPRNDVEHAPASCAGPCDHATPPTGVDRSILFDITIPFGK